MFFRGPEEQTRQRLSRKAEEAIARLYTLKTSNAPRGVTNEAVQRTQHAAAVCRKNAEKKR